MFVGTAFFLHMYFRNMSKNKLLRKIGKDSEYVISTDLEIWAKNAGYKLIKSAVFKYSDNTFFECDAILISTRCIYVIEMKSINGEVSGSANDDDLRKVFQSTSYSIKNPITQNQKHIEHLLQMTPIKWPMLSLIVFSNATKKVSIQDIPDHVIVARHHTMNKTLEKVESLLPIVLKPKDMHEIYKNISSFKVKSKKDLLEWKKIIGK